MTPTTPTNHLWQTVAGILLILWLATTFFLGKRLKQLKGKLNAIPTPKQHAVEEEKTLFNKALSAIKTEDQSMTQRILEWIEISHKESGSMLRISSLQDIKSNAPEIYKQLKALEENLYSPKKSSQFDKNALIDEVRLYRQKNNLTTKRTHSNRKTRSLEPFYQ